MSSTTPPLLPTALPGAVSDGPPKFIAPVMKVLLLLSIVSALGSAAFAFAASEIRQWSMLQELINGADLAAVPPSLLWLGRHAVALNVGLMLFCMLDAVVCWGVLRGWRWALWMFIGLLLVTIPFNFVGVWVVDDVASHLTTYLSQNLSSEEALRMRKELLVQRIFYTGTFAATAISLAAMHLWLAVRLLRPDVQRWYRG